MVRQGSDTGPVGHGARAAEQQLLDDVMRAATEERMKQRIAIPVRKKESRSHGVDEENVADTELSSPCEGKAEENSSEGSSKVGEGKTASLAHVLTNAVILQEFVLEITAIMQVRASMFDEVAFV